MELLLDFRCWIVLLLFQLASWWWIFSNTLIYSKINNIFLVQKLTKLKHLSNLNWILHGTMRGPYRTQKHIFDIGEGGGGTKTIRFDAYTLRETKDDHIRQCSHTNIFEYYYDNKMSQMWKSKFPMKNLAY